MHSPDPLRHSFAALLGEQVRVVALALRREAVFAAIVLAGICILVVATGARYGERLDMMPEVLQPTLVVALLLPFAVWKGDPVFGGAFLWTLPVRRQTIALAKVTAGALWLMAAMLVTFVALSLAAATTGGSFGISVVRLVGGDIASASRVAWTTPYWAWLTPFGAALIFYLASSAAVLGLRHPVRWLAGTVVALFLLMVIGVAVGPDGAFERGIEAVRGALLHGTYGLDFAVTGGATSLVQEIHRPGPGSRTLWTALPEAGRWAMAVLVWLFLTLLMLALAIRRHWER